MRWKTGRRSSNVEDQRGQRRKGISLGGKRGGISTIVIVLAAAYFGIDPAILSTLLQPGTEQGSVTTERAPQSAESNQLAEFVSVVLADTEDTWNGIFKKYGAQYKEPRLVLFTDVVKSACGMAQSAMGPFYCSADQKVFIDLGFYRELKNRHNAPGDFAQAYVIAHEVGHHVQALEGTSQKVHASKARLSKEEANALSVRLELQADCYAGIWAHHADRTRNLLETGDVEEALRAASAIGDDTLQKQAQGYVTPESFTHGTAAQRIKWFKQGLNNGNIESCDTFKAKNL